MAKVTKSQKRISQALRDVVDAHYTRAAAEESVLNAQHLHMLAILDLEQKVKVYRKTMSDHDLEATHGTTEASAPTPRKTQTSKSFDASIDMEEVFPISATVTRPTLDSAQGPITMTEEEVDVALTSSYIAAVHKVQTRLGCSLQLAKDLVEATVGVPDFTVQ